MNKRAAAWPRVLSGMIGMLSAGVMFTWSYFKAPLKLIYPEWTESMLALIFTVHNFATGIAMVLGGSIVKRFPARICLSAGCLMVGTGLMIMSFLPETSDKAYTIALLSYGVLSGFGVGIAGPSVLNTCARWAPERMGLIDGLVLFVYSLAPLIYGALASAIIPQTGILVTFRILACVSWGLLLVALPMFRHPTEKDNIPIPPPREENPSVREYTTPQAMRTLSFWGMFIFCIFMRTSGLVFSGNAATIAAAFGAAALMGMIYSPANGSASLVCGFLIDKLGFRRTMPLFVGIQLLSCLCLIIGGAGNVMLLILIGLVGNGFAYGGTTALASSGTRLLFGAKNFASTYGLVSLAVLVASTFSTVGGIVIDKTNGNYSILFLICALFGLLAMFGTLLILADLKKNRMVVKSCLDEKENNQI